VWALHENRPSTLEQKVAFLKVTKIAERLRPDNQERHKDPFMSWFILKATAIEMESRIDCREVQEPGIAGIVSWKNQK
jgi:hypothetical protein